MFYLIACYLVACG